MYGQGAGPAGVATTITGVAMLPNTGSSAVLTVLSYATIAAGVVVTSSFVATRLVGYFSK